jgi:hypothetical protein
VCFLFPYFLVSSLLGGVESGVQGEGLGFGAFYFLPFFLVFLYQKKQYYWPQDAVEQWGVCM